MLWQGFEMDFEVEVGKPVEDVASELIAAAEDFMVTADCAECLVNLYRSRALEDQASTDAEEATKLVDLLCGAAAAATDCKHQLARSEQRKAIVRPESSLFTALGVVKVSHGSLVPLLPRADFVSYNLACSPSSLPAVCCQVFTRERPKTLGVGAAGLLSNLLHDGIDNTGNVRVWEAEQMLLYHLVKQVRSGDLSLAGKSILELGGGMTGLCGLGLAQFCRHQGIPVEIAVTDGHPDCVRNQKVCLAMNASIELRGMAFGELAGKTFHSAFASSSLLRWSLGDKHGDLERIFLQQNRGKRGFDFILAADCLFFRDFHDDLVWLLDNALDKVNGVAYLLQPRRGDSMQMFLTKAEGDFQVQVQDEFCEEITQQISRASQVLNSGFSADLHSPLLITLKRR